MLSARSKLPHLSLNHLKSLLGRKCLLPLINLPDFDMNYLIPDISMATTCRFTKRNLRVEISNREFANHSLEEFPSVSISSNNYRYHNLSDFLGEEKKKRKIKIDRSWKYYSKLSRDYYIRLFLSITSENVKRFSSRYGDPIFHVLCVPVCGVRDCDRRPLH